PFIPFYMKKIFIISIISTFFLPLYTSAQENLSVLEYWKFHRSQPHLDYSRLMTRATDQLQKRKEAIAKLKTSADWTTRQQEVNRLLQEMAGPFPDKTPLNPVITGTVERDGIKVEKLYF